MNPPVEKGCQRSFWCETEAANGKRTNRVLVYMNEYEMGVSDECDNAPEDNVRYDEDRDEWFWTGWFAPCCEHCETYWFFHEKVLRWKELPKFEDEITSQPARHSAASLLTDAERERFAEWLLDLARDEWGNTDQQLVDWFRSEQKGGAQ